ncbi:hypothetical protein GCM10019991_03040 [Enterococcus casseliflavus]
MVEKSKCPTESTVKSKKCCLFFRVIAFLSISEVFLIIAKEVPVYQRATVRSFFRSFFSKKAIND